jgi:hypothetical protein
MAPTKAKATYAATTLSLLTKVMGSAPLVHVVPAINAKASKAFPAKKVSVPVYLHLSTAEERGQSWLKTREINALKSP